MNALDHAVLALEMPPMALSLYREYARDTRTPPVFGGEMSAAIQASTAPVVGIDGPSTVFFRTLSRTLQEERASVRDRYRLARSVIAVSRHTLVCKLAAIVATHTSMRIEVGTPVAHGCSATDSPGDQADDERRCVFATRSLLESTDPPASLALRERAREACMAQNLRRLRTRGDVVAIVGIDHLDPLVERLSEA